MPNPESRIQHPASFIPFCATYPLAGHLGFIQPLQLELQLQLERNGMVCYGMETASHLPALCKRISVERDSRSSCIFLQLE